MDLRFVAEMMADMSPELMFSTISTLYSSALRFSLSCCPLPPLRPKMSPAGFPGAMGDPKIALSKY
jgi:hypothetical protein